MNFSENPKIREMEIRAIAIQIKTDYISKAVLGCLVANRSFKGELFDEELREIENYIRDGTFPCKPKV